MKGLLLKDLYNLSGQLKIYILYPILAGFLAYQQGSAEIIAISCSFISIFVILSACAYDEMANFEPYALTLPLTRKDLVLSKYQLGFLVTVASALCSILVSAIMIAIFPSRLNDVIWQEILVVSIVISIVMNCLICIQLPFIFRYGTEKARIVMMVAFLMIGAGIYMIASLDLSWFRAEYVTFLTDYGLYILAVVAIILELLSIMLSNHIMMKKEV